MNERADSNIPRVRAYFITFATYGARLHGNVNGSVDFEHRVYGTALLLPNRMREQFERERMAEPGYRLDEERRNLVLRSCREVCRFRGWWLFTAHVRSNHVHVVLQAGARPERVLNDLKAYASRALTRAKPEETDRRRWARHGSTRYLWTDEQLRGAIQYVLKEQGERMAVYIAPGLWHEPTEKQSRDREGALKNSSKHSALPDGRGSVPALASLARSILRTRIRKPNRTLIAAAANRNSPLDKVSEL